MKMKQGLNASRRLLSLVLCAAMVLSLLPVSVFAAEGDGVCAHHPVHTADCGYVAAAEAQPCGHRHDGSCGYQEAHACGHQHDGACGDQQAHPCGHVHTEACGENGAQCAHNHDGVCGYAEARDCAHSHDESCGYREAHACGHVHDSSCGYAEAVAGQPCGFVCQQCAAAERVQAFLDAVDALNPDSPDADALLDAACEALDALEDEDRELPEVQEAMAALDEALGIVPEEAAPYIDIPEIPTVPEVYPSATQIRLRPVGFPSITGTKVQKDQKLLGFTVEWVENAEICLTVSYMGNSSGTITLPKASDLWEYDTPNELLRIVWNSQSGKKEGDQASYGYGLNVAQYDFKGTTVTYRLVYDLDGGEGNIPSASKTTDERECKFDVTTQKPTQAGYIFLGWAETRGASTPSTKTSYTVKRSEGTTKTLYAVWKRLVTVTYTDGVDGVTLFADQSHTVESGSDTPVFQGTPTRTGYVFSGWKHRDILGGEYDWQNKIYSDITYTATWKEDKNSNGVADENESKYTITYQDGANGQYFDAQTFTNLLSGLDTPAFTNTANRPNYVISGWDPSWSQKVTKTVTYTAKWSKDDNNNGKPDENEPKYTVTYVDGLNGAIFQPETHSGLLTGLPTPGFSNTAAAKRQGYVFYGWKNWKSTVTGNVTYTAIWEPDINGNNKADKDETKYTVTYRDGVNSAAFRQEQHTNQLINMPTPAFTGKTEREGYVFDGWNPDVRATIGGNATYTAKWEVDVNGNGVADRDDPKYTILYTDGVKNETIFADQVHFQQLAGMPTPAFSGTPTRSGYVFGGWSSNWEETISDTAVYVAIWKLDANGNGTPDEEEISFTGDPSKTYDAAPVSMDQLYEIDESATAVVEYKRKGAEDSTYTTIAPKDAGEYTVRITVSGQGSDAVAMNTLDFTIRPRSVTVTGIIAKDKTFDGEVTAALNYDGAAFDGIVEGDTLTVTGTAAFDNANAGEKKTVNITGLTLGGDSKENYTLSSTTSTVTATINPKPLSDSDITVTATNLTYTGAQQSPAVTVKYGEITLKNATDYTLSDNTATNADTYTLTVTGKGNYSGFATLDWEITKAPITPKTAIEDVVYGEALNPTVSGNPENGTVTYTYYSDPAFETAVTPKNVGTYYVIATVAETDNYQSGTSEAVSFQITEASLTVKANDHTITYGDEPANDGVSFDGFVYEETEAVLGGTLTYEYSYDQYDDVGSYTIIPSGLTSGNYDITFEKGTLTVEQKELGISWDNTELTYNGKAQMPTADPTGTVNNDAITLTVSGAKTNSGSGYTAKVTAIQGDKAGNYALPENVTTTFSIAQKEVTIEGTAVAATKVYDSKTTAQITSEGTLSANFDGANLTIVPGTAAYDNKNVGEGKEVTFSGFSLGGSAAGNYTLTAQPASVKADITAKPVTITVTVKDKSFDGTNSAEIDTATLNDIEEGDEVTLVNGTPTFAYANVGEDISISFTDFSLEGTDAGNYDLAQPTGITASIKPAPNYLDLTGEPDFDNQTDITIGGVTYPIQTDNGRYVNLPAEGDLLTIYTYVQGSAQGTHENYPTGMAVYRITRADTGATVEKIPELNDLLQYSGCSIRITGKRGIRMITSLTKDNKAALKKGNLAGFKLQEYGTVIQWADLLGGQNLTLETGKHNYAYKRGVADPVFAAPGYLTQYTNVLVWSSLTDVQLGQDIVMRPYITLKDAEGQTVTLYGGTVTRSIGYIAYQNRATFNPGTSAYEYVWNIIHAVYGDIYDSEYQK